VIKLILCSQVHLSQLLDKKLMICTHLSGNTPQWSWPTTLRPLMASVLALSPSVRMSVHRWLLRVPASLASVSLVTPAGCGHRP
jgi:hypothetical protein